MRRLCVLSILLASAAFSQEVLEVASKIAKADAKGSWPKFVQRCDEHFAQFEKDNPSATRSSFLDDRLRQITCAFEEKQTVGGLKSVVFWLGLYHEWQQMLPASWEKGLTPYLTEIKALPEEVDWNEFLVRVKERLNAESKRPKH
jgi:hypothetical protein